MSLPTSRNETATSGSGTVKASLINAIQDCITGMKKPGFWRYQVIARGWVETNVAFDTAGTYGTGQISASANGLVYAGPCLIDLLPGDRLLAISARIYGTGGAQTVPVSLGVVGAGDTTATFGNIQAVNPAAAWATFTDTPVTPVVLADGRSAHWRISGPLSGTKFGVLGIQIDRL